MNEHFELLGKKAKDRVTGYVGVVTSLSFDLYGCIQVVLSPPTGKDGKIENGNWFDVNRIKITKDKAVMDVPDFNEGHIAEGKKGCTEKLLP